MKEIKWQSVKLGEIAIQDRVIITPDSPDIETRPYLGLDQIEAHTGRILSYDSTSAEGKSNAFAFDTTHVLYGKLRPYLNKVAVPERKGRCSTEIIPLKPKGVDRDFLGLLLRRSEIVDAAMSEKTGSRMPRADMDSLFSFEVKIPKSIDDQRNISNCIKAQLSLVEKSQQAVTEQLSEASKLADVIIFDSLNKKQVENHKLGDVLEEVKLGIGKNWAKYPVLGATREGLAPAKEPPGKKPERYKPAFPGTIFYNPMRILIGSIAFVDDDDEPGITSPDYVVLKGKEGLVDSRWFYYWLRSPLGKQCINSLARGAVRERMLFNRLAEGKITLPGYGIQKLASQALTALKPMRAALQHKLDEITLLPQKILARAFGG